MAQYNSPDIAIAGLKVDGSPFSRVESWAAQETITAGYPVWAAHGNNTKLFKTAIEDTAKVVFDENFVENNNIAMTVNTIPITPVLVGTTPQQLTVINQVIAALNALTGVEAYLDMSDINHRSLYVVTSGIAITVTATVTGGASQPVATITKITNKYFVGVALFTQRMPINEIIYNRYTEISVLNRGIVWVVVDSPVVAGNIAYVKTTNYFSTAGTDVGCKYRSNDIVTSTGERLAQIEINGIK